MGCHKANSHSCKYAWCFLRKNSISSPTSLNSWFLNHFLVHKGVVSGFNMFLVVARAQKKSFFLLLSCASTSIFTCPTHIFTDPTIKKTNFQFKQCTFTLLEIFIFFRDNLSKNEYAVIYSPSCHSKPVWHFISSIQIRPRELKGNQFFYF